MQGLADYLNSLMKETNKNKRKQELTDKLLAYKVNRYEADKIRKEITKKTEEINKILEPIVTQINNDNTFVCIDIFSANWFIF